MTIDDDRAKRYGVQIAYDDALGQRQEAPARSVDLVVSSLDRGDGRDGPDTATGPAFVPVGTTDLPERVAGHRLVLEDGSELGPVHRLPPDVPPGLHALHGEEGATLLVVHPAACWCPDDLRRWGW